MLQSRRRPVAGEIYRHFKDKLYEIVDIAIHSETEEEMVVYKQMYGAFQTYVRPLAMFLSEVDREKYPNVKQKYRFEKVGTLQKDEEIEMISGVQEKSQKEDKKQTDDKLDLLLCFLDARTYGEKLKVLEDVTDLDDRTINNMAISMDLVISEGASDERLIELRECIRTKAKYEYFRLH